MHFANYLTWILRLLHWFFKAVKNDKDYCTFYFLLHNLMFISVCYLQFLCNNLWSLLAISVYKLFAYTKFLFSVLLFVYIFQLWILSEFDFEVKYYDLKNIYQIVIKNAKCKKKTSSKLLHSYNFLNPRNNRKTPKNIINYNKSDRCMLLTVLRGMPRFAIFAERSVRY